jgi:hypothetical protein
MKDLVGDYQYDSHRRALKEVMFESGTNHGRNGAYYVLRHPRMKA